VESIGNLYRIKRYFGVFLALELVQDSLAELKMACFSSFSTFFQLRSSGYVPSKRRKMTKNALFLPTAENPEQDIN
jgi:hypothetical protein